MKRKLCLFLLFACAIHAYADSDFALSEHLVAADQVKLAFDSHQAPEQYALLHLKNGLALTYGNIVSLVDLYGIPEQPIAFGQTEDEQNRRFLAAFATLAEADSAVTEANLLNLVIISERDITASAMNNGVPPEEAFKQINNEINRQINCITGGGCGSLDWWMVPGRYLKLTLENYDHFSPFAERAYSIGHQLAIEQAMRAKTSQRREDLELAYALDAFACHYLSDLFAAGHQRTPRSELTLKASPPMVGSLLAGYMHNEENHYGLPVHDQLGNHWQSFGDFFYFDKANQINRNHLIETLQLSVDEVFDAYVHGAQHKPSRVALLIPHYDEGGSQSTLSISPLFYWDSKAKQLLRRKDLANVYDRHWTNNWWGWTTLLALRDQYGLTQQAQAFGRKFIEEAKTSADLVKKNQIMCNT